MIQIVNIGGPDNDPLGEHEYEVRINNRPIVRFIHRRANGLAECLRLAGEAVKKDRVERLIKVFKENRP